MPSEVCNNVGVGKKISRERILEMTCFDPDIYNEDNLKQEDKKRIREIEFVKRRVLNEAVVDEFVSQYSFGEKSAEVMKEVLLSFMYSLCEKVDYCICDMIIEAIDGYSDEEFETLCKKAGKENSDENKVD